MERVESEKKTFQRGRNYLIYLLSARDYTTKEIENKLKKADYSDDIIEEVIQYGIDKHYLDDMRYAQDYIRLKKSKKSVRQLKYQLSVKGIPDYILNQIEDTDDKEELQNKICKYREKKTGTDYEKDAKTYQYFVRKGYNSCIIKELLQNISHN